MESRSLSVLAVLRTHDVTHVQIARLACFRRNRRLLPRGGGFVFGGEPFANDCLRLAEWQDAVTPTAIPHIPDVAGPERADDASITASFFPIFIATSWAKAEVKHMRNKTTYGKAVTRWTLVMMRLVASPIDF